MFNIEDYNYTKGKDWFRNSELRHLLVMHYPRFQLNTMLEIGSFEGLSSCFFADDFLEHKDSTLTCVDPFDLSIEKTPVTSTTKEIFTSNIQNTSNYSKINTIESFSDEFFKTNVTKYNFIYIDGSHIPEDIVRDMDNAWKCLQQGGIMWMDDYKGNQDITSAINEQIKKWNQSDLCIIHMGYQLALRKLTND